MNPFLNERSKQISYGATNSTVVSKTGTVQSFDPQAWTISVLFDEADTDDTPAGGVVVPLTCQWLGSQWGLFCAPVPGTPVFVVFQDASLQLPIAVGFLPTDVTAPFPGINSGEFYLVHQTGSLLKLTNDGDVHLLAKRDLYLGASNSVYVQATNAINLEAPLVTAQNNLVVENNLTANEGQTTMEDGVFTTTTLNATNEVTAAGISLTQHVHGGVEEGGGETEPPTG